MTNRKEYTIGLGWANMWAMLLMLPLALVFIVPFGLIWGLDALDQGKDFILNNIVLILLVGIVVHELLHGIVWAYYVPNKWRSIKFGIKWLTPYCHCKEALKT